jgi:transcription-repair coupling factor (superfamily II helicase)
MVIGTLSSTPARRMLRIALRRRSWIETPAKERQPVSSATFVREFRAPTLT